MVAWAKYWLLDTALLLMDGEVILDSKGQRKTIKCGPTTTAVCKMQGQKTLQCFYYFGSFGSPPSLIIIAYNEDQDKE